MAVIEALKQTMRRVPVKAWLAAGGLLAGALWLQQHDARIRQQARLQQVRNQASAEVTALRRQAAQDVKQANVENAKAVAELEQRRQQAEQQSRQLAAQLARLRTQAQAQAGEVAALPISEIATRVAGQLGLSAGDVAGNGEAGAKPQDKLKIMNYELPPTGAPSAPGGEERAAARDGAEAGSKLQITNDELEKPGAPSAGARVRNQDLCDLCGPKAVTQSGLRSSVSSVLDLFKSRSAQRRRGEEIRNSELRIAKPDGGEEMGGVYPGQNAGILRSAQDDKQGARDVRQGAEDDKAALALTASGARKVEAALVALDACRAESNIQAQQVSNCQARAEADDAAIKRQADSIAGLNRALEAKDKIMSLQQSECSAELRAARGTFLQRLARTAEHVAIGVALGVAIGVAVK